MKTFTNLGLPLVSKRVLSDTPWKRRRPTAGVVCMRFGGKERALANGPMRERDIQ